MSDIRHDVRPCIVSTHCRNQWRVLVVVALSLCMFHSRGGGLVSALSQESTIGTLPASQTEIGAGTKRKIGGRLAIRSSSKLKSRCMALVGGSQEQKAQQSSTGIVAVESRTRVSAFLDGLRSGASSAMAAACVKTLLQPLDAVKTLQQFHKTANVEQRALSTLEAARTLMSRPGGIANLYAGLGVTVVGSLPGVALYFGLYQFCKRKFLQTTWGEDHRLLSVALAAALGNTFASASRTPYEVLKQQLQMGTYPTFRAAAKAVLSNPIESLFPKGGMAIQIIRDVPYAVVTLVIYESLQEILRSRGDLSSKTKKQWDFVIGGLSGGIGSWVTNPLDVLKTRLQTDSANLYDGSLVTCTSMVWKEGGAAAFLRGSVPRLMHKIPANCFFFLFYEMFRRLMKAPQPDRNSKDAGKQ